MQKTLLLTFNTEDQRNELISHLKLMHVQCEMQLDPAVKTNDERECSLFVSGSKLTTGSFTDISKLFAQEIAVHSGSVEIREKRGDEWMTIRRRMKQ